MADPATIVTDSASVLLGSNNVAIAALMFFIGALLVAVVVLYRSDKNSTAMLFENQINNIAAISALTAELKAWREGMKGGKSNDG